jgi:hypothetical protein
MTKTHDTEHDVTNGQHRAGCVECRTLWAELDQISAQAARLPLLRPSRDLWAGIEARTGGTADAPQTMRPFFTRPMVRFAIAASLLMAVSSAVTWQVASNRDRLGVGEVAADIAAGVDLETAETLHLASFQETVTSMDREIAVLQAMVADRRKLLDPQTVSVLEANLRVIDRAIQESRAALVADPASRFLSEQFTRAYNSKLTLLRDAATLPVGI